jgi:hypothetical protein
VKREIFGGAVQLMCHGDNRRDADTSADQNRAAGTLHERKKIARRTNPDTPTGVQTGVDARRAAARTGAKQDADPIDAPVRWISAQRILPHQPRRHVDIDMRAGLEWRQGGAMRVDQIEDDDAWGLLFAPRD